MIDGLAVGLVAAGLLLSFSGAVLSVYGVVAAGALLGGGGGYLVGPAVGGLVGLEGAVAPGVTIAVGALAGALAGYAFFSAAAALVSFAVASGVTLAAVSPAVLDQPWYVEWGTALTVGVVAAALATLFTKRTMIGVTAVVGAALASRSLTADQIAAAHRSLTLDPLLFDVGSPLFLSLVAGGILVQCGLVRFGRVRRVTSAVAGLVLPGRQRADPAN